MLPLLSLAAATLVSEDLTCITTGLLIQRGDIDAWSGVSACAAGIFAGDFGLWALGRLGGQAVLKWEWLARHLEGGRYDGLRSWISRRAGQAIIASRFLPGTRLPLYVVAGFTGLPAAVFARWAFLATALWTPILVMFTASMGEAFVSRVSPLIGSAWLANATAAILTIAILRTIRIVVARRS